MADTAAKDAASLPVVICDLKYSQKEISSKLRKTLWAKREEHLKELGRERGWLVLPASSSGHHPPLPVSLLKILRRIRTNGCCYRLFPVACECGEPVSFLHLFGKCSALEEEFRELHGYATTHKLLPHQFLVEHDTLGWGPVHLLCRSVYRSKVSHNF